MLLTIYKEKNDYNLLFTGECFILHLYNHQLKMFDILGTGYFRYQYIYD